jgi:cytochrome subunit of sulfide dehydrogenase
MQSSAPHDAPALFSSRTESTMTGNRVAIATFSVLTAMCAFAQATDPTLARNIAASCANCHGMNGASIRPIPPLAGVPRVELVNRMQEFKSGKRAGTIMPQLAKGYTDEQLEAVATWFAKQPAPAK